MAGTLHPPSVLFSTHFSHTTAMPPYLLISSSNLPMMLELIKNSAYIREVQHLENHNLALSTEKTKEIMADFTEEVVRVTNLKKSWLWLWQEECFYPKTKGNHCYISILQSAVVMLLGLTKQYLAHICDTFLDVMAPYFIFLLCLLEMFEWYVVMMLSGQLQHSIHRLLYCSCQLKHCLEMVAFWREGI